MNQSRFTVAVLSGVLCAGIPGFAAATPVLKIPVRSIGAPLPKVVSVDYLRGDRSVVQQLLRVPLSDGFLALSPVPGSSEVRIAAEGFDPAEVSLSIAALGVSLPALSELVLEWPFKREAKLPPSVEIYLLPREKRPSSNKAATLVPSTHRFSAMVPPGDFTLLVYSPGAGIAISTPSQFLPGSPARPGKLQVLASRDSLFRVTDSGGHPIQGASLRLKCEEGTDPSSPVVPWLASKRWRADAKGQIELQSVPHSPCTPSIAARGYRTLTLKSLRESAGSPVPETVALRPLPQLNLELAPSITGTDGAADVTLIVSEADAVDEPTEEAISSQPKKIWSGRIRSRETIRGLEGGLYRALARAGSRTAGVEFRLFASADAPDEQTVRILFEPRNVRGHVLVGENPGRQIPVDALPHGRRIQLDAEPIASTTTDENGSFELPVSYLGSIVLRARFSEKNVIYRAIEPDPDPDKEVVLRGWASAITLRAFDAGTGKPVLDGMLELTHSQADGRKLASSRPVPGETTLTGLGAGRLKLSLSSPRHRVYEMELTLSGDEEMPLDFMLTPKSTVVLVVTGEGGEPVGACEVLSVDSTKVPVPGTANFQNLGRTDWSGRLVLDDLPSNTVLAFVRPGYGLQFSRSSSGTQESGSELSVRLPSLREKFSPGEAQQLAERLSGLPTFAVDGFLVPDGLGRRLAISSGLDDRPLLRAGPEGLLLWSRILPPGQYMVFARPSQPILSSDGKETEVQSRPRVATAIFN